MSKKNKELKAQANAARLEDAVPSLTGKTIESSTWDKHGNLRLTFTDSTYVEVCYSCYGGVIVADEQGRVVAVGEKR